jgi:hypothetical protein
MKPLLQCASLFASLASLALFAGCASTGSSTNAIPVSSTSMSCVQASNNPALSVPQGGMHPVFGIEYADKQISGGSGSVDRYQAISLNTGAMWQPSLENGDCIESFLSANLSVSAIASRVDIDRSTKQNLALAGIQADREFLDWKADCAINPGFLIKRDPFLALFFLQGIVKYEDGEASRFRHAADGRESLYNIVGNNLTFGFGFGGELQGGTVGKWDAGVAIKTSVLVNRTQSIAYADQNARIESAQSIPGGDFYRRPVFSFEPYIDYEKVRFSVLVNSGNRYGFQISYRF